MNSKKNRAARKTKRRRPVKSTAATLLSRTPESKRSSKFSQTVLELESAAGLWIRSAPELSGSQEPAVLVATSKSESSHRLLTPERELKLNELQRQLNELAK